MHYLVNHVRSLLHSQDFRQEYCFYIGYAAIIGFVVQVVILDATIHDYLIVLGLQMISLLASALVFVSLNTHFQPSHRLTKMLYFVLTDGPWMGMIYYWFNDMVNRDIVIYLTLSMIATIIGGWLYDNMFDRCCDRGYRLKTLYQKHRKHRHP